MLNIAIYLIVAYDFVYNNSDRFKFLFWCIGLD